MTRTRNAACGLFAAGVVALGRVRRARRQAFSSGAVTSIYFHNPEAGLFRYCIEWLTRYGYTFISATEVAGFIEGANPLPPGAVWLSFDDGRRGLLQNVLPFVRERHIPVTLFIPSGIIEGDGIFPAKSARSRTRAAGRDCLSVEELREVSAYPEVTIGSHTVSHAVTASCSEQQLRHEICHSRRRLEELVGKPVRYFAYPKGVVDGRERAVLSKCGYAMAVTVENALVTTGIDPYLVPRFSVADRISRAEAVCNLVGVWGPVIKRVKASLPNAAPERRKAAGVP